MYCVQCGSKVPDGSKFCTECGAPMPAPKAVYPPKAPAASAIPQQVKPDFVDPQPAAVQQIPAAVPVQAPTVPVKSKYKRLLIFAILLTAFAYLTSNMVALIIGIIAIIQAAKAKKKETAGSLDEARAAGKITKALDITALVLNIIWLISLIVALVVVIRMAVQSASLIAGGTPEGIQEFLRQYGYEYDIDLIREWLRYNGAFLLGL